MTAIVRWENPPPPHPRGGMRETTGKWRAIDNELRSAPGRWALVVVCPSDNTAASIAHHIRMGTVRPLARGDFEAVARRDHVYARYLGDGAT